MTDQPEPAAWKPPPPGDRREQLPDHLLALLDIPPYTSTACEAASLLAWQMPKLKHRRAELGDHADRLHSRCRLQNKFTGQPCSCPCHQQAAAADSSDTPASTMARWLLEGARDLDVPAADAWTPDPPNGCLTVTAEPDPFGYEERERTGRNAGLTLTPAQERLAQYGVDTPGCDCDHDGMGVSWHGDDCPWRCSILDGAKVPTGTAQATLTVTVNAPDPVHAVRWAGHVRDLVHAEFGQTMRMHAVIEAEPPGAIVGARPARWLLEGARDLDIPLDEMEQPDA
jgi:hypothetical protein